MNLFLKLSYLNSYFVLTLGYLNPALNNPAWKNKFCMLICSPPYFFLYSFKLFMIQGQLRTPVTQQGSVHFLWGVGGGRLCQVGFDQQLLYMKTLSSSEFFWQTATPLLVPQDQITRIQVNFSQQKCYDFFGLNGQYLMNSKTQNQQ